MFVACEKHATVAVQALPLISSIIGLLLGFIFITGLTGMQLYSNAYHFACANNMTGALKTSGSEEQAVLVGCGGSRVCPANYTCIELSESSSMSENVAGFDNIGSAMLTAFQVRMPLLTCKFR